MRILFLGDIVGKTAREAVAAQVPVWRRDWKLDCVIVNGENAINGMGINRETVELLLKAGVDCITTGNHAFHEKKEAAIFEQYPQLLRPLNFSANTPGRGAATITLQNRQKVLVINPIAQTFMPQMVDNPFHAVEKILANEGLKRTADAIVIDFHGEATSEKMAMGFYCDGRVSAVIGTHTHMPSADTMILPQGTAFQSDSGMCGDYNSVLGMVAAAAVKRFTHSFNPDKRGEIMTGPATLCGVYLETDDRTGLASRAMPVRYGQLLINTLPM